MRSTATAAASRAAQLARSSVAASSGALHRFASAPVLTQIALVVTMCTVVLSGALVLRLRYVPTAAASFAGQPVPVVYDTWRGRWCTPGGCRAPAPAPARRP